MDAARKKEVEAKTTEEEFGDWLRKMQKSVLFAAAFMSYMAIRFIGFAVSVSPYYMVQDRKVLYLVVSSMVALFASGSIGIFMVSELPMKKSAWMRMYKLMVVMAGTSLIVAAFSVAGIRSAVGIRSERDGI